MSNSTESVWPSRRELLLIVGFWTLLAALVAGTRSIDPRAEEGLFSNPFLWSDVGRVFTRHYMWAALTPPIFWLAARFLPARERIVRAVLFYLVLGIGVAIAVDLSNAYLRAEVFPTERDYSFRPLKAIFGFWFFSELIAYGAILATGFARAFYLRQREREVEAQQLRTQKAELEAQLSDARLDALRMQLNPHFLFNTLHAISTLVGRDPQGVRRMIARLSTLLRYVLDENGQQEVPLHEEMTFLRGYLEIQEIRFQGRLEVEIDVDDEIDNALVPTLILQPIVENAVKHGADAHPGMGRVAIRGHRDDKWLVLEVADNGPGLDSSSAEEILEQGTGLSNADARLDALYGDDYQLTFERSDLDGLNVVLRLPYHEEDDLYTPSFDGDSRDSLPVLSAEPSAS